MVKHYTPAQIWAVIEKGDSDQKQTEPQKTWGHTLLDISPEAVKHIVRVFKKMPNTSPFAVGMAGWGKSYLLQTMLASESRYERGDMEPEVYVVKDWDELRELRLIPKTPIFFDDGMLKKAAVSLLKDILGERAGNAARKI